MRQDFIVTVKVYLKKTDTYIFPMKVSLGVRDHAFMTSTRKRGFLELSSVFGFYGF